MASQPRIIRITTAVRNKENNDDEEEKKRGVGGEYTYAAAGAEASINFLLLRGTSSSLGKSFLFRLAETVTLAFPLAKRWIFSQELPLLPQLLPMPSWQPLSSRSLRWRWEDSLAFPRPQKISSTGHEDPAFSLLEGRGRYSKSLGFLEFPEARRFCSLQKHKTSP